ncbi:Golgi membrane exchange factor (Ric1p-Rgp1p) subunit [Elasticomyces elasticus]|nr:Golgi membrane exchange factor (Ric1p-Rgp1p) subunit [Elasticomyces elasticus]
MSIHSDETVTSEPPYPHQQKSRLLPKVTQSRQVSRSTYRQAAEPGTLIMGYVQTMGGFTLDGSQLSAAPFEELKRKGAQTGGGVVGVERSKRKLGMFVAFSWGNIGELRSGLLGGDEMSSMAQIKSTSGFPHIPLLSVDTVRFRHSGHEGCTQDIEDTKQDLNGALLSPTSPAGSPVLSRKQSIVEQAPASIREAIDVAILRFKSAKASSKQGSADAHSTNRCNIALSGQAVAVLTLIRPAYRLGEAVTGSIDFTASQSTPGVPAQAATYAVLLELESAERLYPSLALRSSTSIARVTRKVHATVHENTLLARQVSFSFAIAHSATPTFETTGVSLAWRLSIEFTISRWPSQASGIADGGMSDTHSLLEELDINDRGTALCRAGKTLGRDV